MSQVALITGGGGGIGGAVARRMAAAGITVVVADYDHGAAERVREEITKAGGKAEALSVDVTQAREVKALVTDVGKRFGCIDVSGEYRRRKLLHQAHRGIYLGGMAGSHRREPQRDVFNVP